MLRTSSSYRPKRWLLATRFTVLYGLNRSVGDSYDSALAEPVNGLYKAEVIHRQSWKHLEAVELATLAWVDWFNHRRLLEPIGNIPPAEAEANYNWQGTGLAEAA